MWLRRLLRARLLVSVLVLAAVAVLALGTQKALHHVLTPSVAQGATSLPTPSGGGLSVPDTGGAP